MKRIWSPWRSAHIEQVTTPDDHHEGDPSLFSRLAAEDDDEKNLILWRGQHVFVIMNKFPYNNGHLMIVPFREVAAYEQLTTDEQTEIALTIGRCITWLTEALRPEGFNMGMNLGLAAGAGIPDHLHMHIVPRWLGDTNFMPTVADVKVIPEAMEDTYTRLRRVIDVLAEETENT